MKLKKALGVRAETRRKTRGTTKRSSTEVGPGAILRARAVRLRLRTLFVRRGRGWARLDRTCLGLGARDHFPAPRRVRCEDAVVEEQGTVSKRPVARHGHCVLGYSNGDDPEGHPGA